MICYRKGMCLPRNEKEARVRRYIPVIPLLVVYTVRMRRVVWRLRAYLLTPPLGLAHTGHGVCESDSVKDSAHPFRIHYWQMFLVARTQSVGTSMSWNSLSMIGSNTKSKQHSNKGIGISYIQCEREKPTCNGKSARAAESDSIHRPG